MFLEANLTETEIWKIAVPFASAVAGTVVGAWTARSVSRENRAYELYKGYLVRCWENPTMASYDAFVGSTKEEGPYRFDPHIFEDEKVEKYQWFVSLMMIAMEEILHIRQRDEEWRDTIWAQASFHRGYFDAAWPVIRGNYSRSLQSLIDDMLANPDR